jgi:hypothetical protein
MERNRLGQGGLVDVETWMVMPSGKRCAHE